MKLSRRKLSDHTVRRLLKGDGLKSVMTELGAYLIHTRRTGELRLIIRDIEAQLLTDGTALVTITSARVLSEEAKRSIEDFIRFDQSEVKKIILRERLDESVIGGVRIELPGRLADLTVKAKLDKLTA